MSSRLQPLVACVLLSSTVVVACGSPQPRDQTPTDHGHTNAGASSAPSPAATALPKAFELPQTTPATLAPVYVEEAATPAPESPPITDAPARFGAFSIVTMDGVAILVAADGQYLGLISSNPYQADSICNPYGIYGSPTSATSIRNPYGSYGSEYSIYGAGSPYTTSPPAIVLDGYVVGYLTKNGYLPGALDPDALFAAYDCVHD